MCIRFSEQYADIDIQQYDGNVKTYINEYVNYLKTQIGDTNLSGTLITLAELKSLGCTINDDYSYAETGNHSCENSNNRDWLIISQNIWTRSAYPNIQYRVWIMRTTGILQGQDHQGTAGIRPVITISKESLKKQ